MITEENSDAVCHKCGANAHGPFQNGDSGTGVIYVRAQIKKKWGSHPICVPCWYLENPDRMPVMIRDVPLGKA